MTMNETVPNHHAHHAPFSGALAVVAALTMIFGREDNARLAIELSGLHPGDVVVDIGCGPGAAVRRAARAGAIAIGVDPADVMLRTARLLTRGTVSYRKGAAEALPVDDGAAQVVWSIATVHHWRDLDAGLREVRRALAPGGRFVAIERKTRPDARGLAGHGWTREQAAAFAAHCEALGLVDAQVEQHAAGRRPALSVTARDPRRK
jgi:ubiquinone/menaquinone biosynthesis C-methylase UbiE